ncbi:hypothetical protein FRAHR75_130011 [Frankia sp. Hr75.2]|nr:hypothetical protein FRAHR75_130011 [Frankia sp. Hr75.2]
MHAIAETVTRLRATGGHGLVGANGGLLSKYSVGVYSTTPSPWRPDAGATLQAEIDSWEPVEVATRADGWATIETFTITHGRDGRRTGIVVGRLGRLGRLGRDGRRFLATTVRGDADLLDLLTGESPFDERIFVRATPPGNRAAVSRIAGGIQGGRGRDPPGRHRRRRAPPQSRSAAPRPRGHHPTTGGVHAGRRVHGGSLHREGAPRFGTDKGLDNLNPPR